MKIPYRTSIRRAFTCVCIALTAISLTTVDADARRARKSGKRSKTRTTIRKKQRTQAAPVPTITEPPKARVNRDNGKRKIEVSKPDIDAIRKETLDPSGKYYFPKLLAKYNRNDTTMTNDEFRHLYLGYMFQEDYDPYRTSPYSEKTDHLREKKEHTKAEIDTIQKYAELSLKDNPFDLRQMSFLVHVLKERKKDMSAKIWEYRLEHLLGAIKSTGTGEDEENAWYVITPMHEYDMVQLMGYEATDAKYIEPGYDYLVVSPDPETTKRLRGKTAEGFFFNIMVPEQQFELKHPEEETPAEMTPAEATAPEEEENARTEEEEE